GANHTDTAFFAEPRVGRKTRFTAFGMTKRAGRSLANDPAFGALFEGAADAICLVAKSWDFHVRVALGISNDENLAAISESVAAIVSEGREALIDCEHFFDGYKANPEYALACAHAAYESGARWVVLCDTNGGTLPSEVADIVGEVTRHIPGGNLGIHTHDDTGHAVANALAAVDAGARQIQGTLNGIGERCGNANLITLIPTLVLKGTYGTRFETGVSPKQLGKITGVSRQFDEILNRNPSRQSPYVGETAFATKAGIHASAILKDPTTYEHVQPEAVGNHRRVHVSDQGGQSNVLSELERIGLNFEKNAPNTLKLLEIVKEREAIGYAYESADASFELLARRLLGQVPQYFDVESFRVLVERRHNALGELVTLSEATVKVVVDGERLMSVGEGNGPVNALDNALRKDLGRYSAMLEDLELVDYRVRILNGGTDAVTRVLIESQDGTGARWATVGVSSNIVDASFQALNDSIVYKLLKAGASALAA
ncbi:MAG: citramalate synthase, partial [Pseudomonadota bacterium]